jgi:serine/threonine-protein kinase RsbW
MISETLQLVLPSLPASIHQVEKFVENICDEYNINNTYFGNILVTLTEAFENAMIHGNSNDQSKNVNITFTSKPEGLSFMISDEGNGFDVSQVPDPTDINFNNETNKGRGIFLIKSLADDVKFLDNGKKVEILFKIASINSELAIGRINLLKDYSIEKEKASSQQNSSKSL